MQTNVSCLRRRKNLLNLQDFANPVYRLSNSPYLDSVKVSFGHYILEKLDSIADDVALDGLDKQKAIYKTLLFYFDEITEKERVQLTTLFSKISYIGNKYQVRKILLYHLQGFRKVMQADPIQDVAWRKYYLAFAMCIGDIHDFKINRDLQIEFFETYGKVEIVGRKSYLPSLEVLAMSVDLQNKTITAIPNDSPFDNVLIKFDESGVNEIFTPSVMTIVGFDLFPCALYLHDIDVLDTDDDTLLPKIIVIEPHYLLDVTTVARTFDHRGSVPKRSILGRFMKVNPSVNLLIGNVANYFLDEIVNNPEIEFKDLIPEIFQLSPLEIACYDDATVMTLVEQAELHFDHLKKVVNQEFVGNNIHKDNVYLEPSFYAPKYGVQGRLDLFYHQPKEKRAAIVELKSAKVYRPNTYRLNNEHYVQTLLYDLIIKSVYGSQMRSNAFILYSKMDQNHLRHAPVIKSQQVEAINARNEVLLDLLALEITKVTEHVFDQLTIKNIKGESGYQKNNLKEFESVYVALDPVMKEYFKKYSGFIAREQRLSKTGNGQLDNTRGRAVLWQKLIEQKQENFNIINHLVIEKNLSDEELPVFILRKTKRTAELSNFRVGDIAVWYPDQNRVDNALYSQVFKCTILNMDERQVTIRLRSKQNNYEIFKKYDHWHLEHDMLDSSFNSMYQSLFDFAKVETSKQDLWLTRRPPEQYTTPVNEYAPKLLTTEQAGIFKEILSCKDYYLLWGPPGTGKTSVMLQELCRHFFYKTDETILLLAYTNKAVDEICEALYSISALVQNDFIRIGSRFSTKEKFRNRLLSTLTDGIVRRRELKELIAGTRIIVGTLSSIMGRGSSLFELKQFDRIIIDEASQILEPQLISLLCKVPKTILIGDHKQLPAVVQQKPVHSKIDHPELNKLGLVNMADSLFERLYKRCLAQNWDWAIGQLSQQGRMHQDLMKFPNQHFYHDSLRVIPGIDRLVAPRSWQYQNGLEKDLVQHRKIFIPTPANEEISALKTNQYEAKVVAQVIKAHLKLLDMNHVERSATSIGVITPFRAQIACIRAELLAQKIDVDDIAIDTVERFQGDAKDLIILSFCLNHPSQLRSLISKSIEGIDRKLNVAWTRAKEQIVLVGNEAILKLDETYQQLLGQTYRLDNEEFWITPEVID